MSDYKASSGVLSRAAAAPAVPSLPQMYWPTLQALRESGGSATIQEIEERVIRLGNYSEAQQDVLHRGGPQTEISYRLAWVRTYLKIVGAVENSARSVWAITEYGRSLKPGDMASISAKVRKTSRLTSGAELANSTPQEDRPARFSSTVFEKWRDELLRVLQGISPDSFEKLCQRVLRESGFRRVDVTGRSGDGGIDGVGVLRISLLSFQVFFQCKRYKGSVGASAIRDFRGAMVGRTDKGLLITTGYFTAEAKREATRDGAPVLDLIDGDQFCSLLKDLHLGVNTQQVEEVGIDESWYAVL